MSNTHARSAAAAFVALLLAAGGPASSRPQAEAPRASVATVSITVDDMDRALAFYTGVLPFTKLSDEVRSDASLATLTGVGGRRRIARLQLGDEAIELVDYLAAGGRPLPADSRSNDRWFQHVAIIVSDMERAYATLERAGVEHVSPLPQRLPDWNPGAGGIEAFYFHDPDKHALEILRFPPSKGLPKWHRDDGRLFLGIDHTAIVVRETRRSLGFYRDAVGLQVAGESPNYGSEQERLNNVKGARLHITALRGSSGPGVEFLEYLTPRDGRPSPIGGRADDLAHWETVVTVPGLAALADRLRKAGLSFISPAMTRLRTTPAALVRDPDGHAVRLLETTS